MTSRSIPLRIGLTGGIGSGKSTVGQMLQARGAAVIDADAIARQVTAATARPCLPLHTPLDLTLSPQTVH